MFGIVEVSYTAHHTLTLLSSQLTPAVFHSRELGLANLSHNRHNQSRLN